MFSRVSLIAPLKFQTFVFVCFWYQLFCGFSGAVMIDQMYLMLYNLFFTSLPPMAIGKCPVVDIEFLHIYFPLHP